MAKYSLLINKLSGERSIRINKTGETFSELDNPEIYNDLRARAVSALKRKIKNDAMESLGLTKVKGAISGKTYWE